MPRGGKFSVGFDFGTESVRVVVVDIRTGAVAGVGTANYPHGVIDRTLPTSGQTLPPDYALQHPQDWLDGAASACKRAMAKAATDPDQVVGIGVDFTSCTMLPCLADGTPLSLTDKWANAPLAWAKLWKHHGAHEETERINQVARDRKEKWLSRYGGTIGLEWFFPKVLETLRKDPQVYQATDVWLEAGDWFVWQLVDGPFPRCRPETLVRSTCQAGYKGMWSKADGFPSEKYLAAVNPKLGKVVSEKMPGEMRAPGELAGGLSAASAKLLGLNPGTPVATAIIDAHAGVPGAGVAAPSTLVMVMGTSSCHMINARVEKAVPGVAGVVEDGILPGYFGYETGQAAVGDGFAWLVNTLQSTHADLTDKAARLPAGSGGVLAVDWLNGCRTPLMDARVSALFLGMTLGTRPEQLYRAALESTAFGLRWIVDTLRDAGVPVRRFVASGGLPPKSPLLMQIYADVLGERIQIAESDQSVALGAAILGCLAAGRASTGYAGMAQAIQSMARQRQDLAYRPDPKNKKKYARIYEIHRKLTNPAGDVVSSMRELRHLA